MLARALAAAGAMGLLMVALQYPVGELALWAMHGGEMTRDYFYARIWAVPAGILLFGFNGWYTGMQNAVFPMCTAITVNIVHTLCSLWFAFGMDLGIVGIAYASVVAQWTGVALASVLLVAKYRPVLRLIDWSQVLDLRPLKTYFSINRDIILRTFCIVAVYTFFTGSSARLGNQELLAVNALLLELFTLFSYMNDGFAYAAEALTGRFIGARDGGALRRCLKGCLAWGTLISALFVVIYIIDRQRHALHHGRHHGRRHRDACHAQLHVLRHCRLFRHLLRTPSADRQQRPLARLHALHVPARRAAILHDPPSERHPRQSDGPRLRNARPSRRVPRLIRSRRSGNDDPRRPGASGGRSPDAGAGDHSPPCTCL